MGHCVGNRRKRKSVGGVMATPPQPQQRMAAPQQANIAQGAPRQSNFQMTPLQQSAMQARQQAVLRQQTAPPPPNAGRLDTQMQTQILRGLNAPQAMPGTQPIRRPNPSVTPRKATGQPRTSKPQLTPRQQEILQKRTSELMNSPRYQNLLRRHQQSKGTDAKASQGLQRMQERLKRIQANAMERSKRRAANLAAKRQRAAANRARKQARRK